MTKDKNRFINKYLKYIKPYNTVSHKIWKTSVDGNEVLKLDWNEATIKPSPLVINKMQELISKGDFYNLYPNTYNQELLQKLSEYTNIPSKNIQYFASSDATHEYIVRTFISVNAKVLIQSPSYDNFRLSAQAAGGKVFYSDVTEDFKFNEKKFIKDIKKINPRFVYMCSPNNPCGYIIPTDYIEKLLKKFPNIMFLVDEAYCEFSKNSAKDLVLKYKNILISRTMSKAFALANFRFGYLLSAEQNIRSLNKIRNAKNITTFAQEVAIAALSDINYTQSYVEEVLLAKEYFCKELKNFEKYISIYKSNANFVLIKCKSYKIKANLFRYLDNQNIYVRNLTQSPKLYNCIRITIGTQAQMQIVLEAIKNFFNDLDSLKPNINNKKIAFLDFCGTVVSKQTGNAFVYYVKRNLPSIYMHFKSKKSKLFIKIGRFFNKKFYDKWQILSLTKNVLQKDMERLGFNFYIEEVRPYFISQVLEEIETLKKDGYEIYIVSGGYDTYLKHFVDEFNLNGLFCTKIKYKNNRSTAKPEGLDCMCNNKKIIIEEHFGKENLINCDSIAYTDSQTDLPLINICKKGVVVCPKKAPKWAIDNNMESIIYD